MVFQEQLSQAAIHLAGFDPAEADTLRKVVSKKHKRKKLRDFYARFVQGARERGVSPEVIEEVWQMMMGFDGYSFCKPHSASYTLVAYKSAFLRAHYPAEFMAAVISNGGGYYSTFGYLSEARRMGLRICPPDINQSEIKYTGKDREIRVGLMQLKDLGQEAREALVHERRRRGFFSSFEDFLKRMGPRLHLQDVRILIKAGCFDGLHAGRSALLWQALAFFEHPRCPAQETLFPEPGGPAPGKGSPAELARPRDLRLKQEEEALGLLISCHPLERYADGLKGFSPVPARDLPGLIGREVTTVGWPITGKTVHTKDGETMRFVSFEDLSGLYEAVFFPQVYHRYCHLLSGSRPYLLRGRVDEDFGSVTLAVDRIRLLDTRPALDGGEPA